MTQPIGSEAQKITNHYSSSFRSCLSIEKISRIFFSLIAAALLTYSSALFISNYRLSTSWFLIGGSLALGLCQIFIPYSSFGLQIEVKRQEEERSVSVALKEEALEESEPAFLVKVPSAPLIIDKNSLKQAVLELFFQPSFSYEPHRCQELYNILQKEAPWVVQLPELFFLHPYSRREKTLQKEIDHYKSIFLKNLEENWEVLSSGYEENYLIQAIEHLINVRVQEKEHCQKDVILIYSLIPFYVRLFRSFNHFQLINSNLPEVRDLLDGNFNIIENSIIALLKEQSILGGKIFLSFLKPFLPIINSNLSKPNQFLFEEAHKIASKLPFLVSVISRYAIFPPSGKKTLEEIKKTYEVLLEKISKLKSKEAKKVREILRSIKGSLENPKKEEEILSSLFFNHVFPTLFKEMKNPLNQQEIKGFIDALNTNSSPEEIENVQFSSTSSTFRIEGYLELRKLLKSSLENLKLSKTDLKSEIVRYIKNEKILEIQKAWGFAFQEVMQLNQLLQEIFFSIFSKKVDSFDEFLTRSLILTHTIFRQKTAEITPVFRCFIQLFANLIPHGNSRSPFFFKELSDKEHHSLIDELNEMFDHISKNKISHWIDWFPLQNLLILALFFIKAIKSLSMKEIISYLSKNFDKWSLFLNDLQFSKITLLLRPNSSLLKYLKHLSGAVVKGANLVRIETIKAKIDKKLESLYLLRPFEENSKAHRFLIKCLSPFLLTLVRIFINKTKFDSQLNKIENALISYICLLYDFNWDQISNDQELDLFLKGHLEAVNKKFLESMSGSR